MLKVLFLPFLSVSSGHHQVADALMEHILRIDPSIRCRKVDILRYGYGPLESVVSQIYLKWIHLWPSSYNWLYRKSVCDPTGKQTGFGLYAQLFRKFIERLLKEERPDLVICTHALPSRMVSQAKRRGRLAAPVVNVYTDFFINNLWGLNGIDFHFVPHASLKQQLVGHGIGEERVFVTGIPVHPEISGSKPQRNSQTSRFVILVTGGSLGVGLTAKLIRKLGHSGKIRYMVLCGKNKRLQSYLEKLRHPHITALPYVSSRREMNALYDQVDGILTKPGGVTISECLSKQVPIFVFHALPGQEQVNLQHLKHHRIIYQFDDWQKDGAIEEKLLEILACDSHREEHKLRMEQYCNGLTDRNLAALIPEILGSVTRERALEPDSDPQNPAFP